MPFLLGLASRAFRADLRRLNRFGPHDRTWLRAARRRDRRPASRPAGKFNAGQKVYAAWIAGAVLVMLATGLLMWFTASDPAGVAYERDLRPRLAVAGRRHRAGRTHRHGARRPGGTQGHAYRVGRAPVGEAGAPAVARGRVDITRQFAVGTLAELDVTGALKAWAGVSARRAWCRLSMTLLYCAVTSETPQIYICVTLATAKIPGLP